jgi:hypothetical protein
MRRLLRGVGRDAAADITTLANEKVLMHRGQERLDS